MGNTKSMTQLCDNFDGNKYDTQMTQVCHNYDTIHTFTAFNLFHNLKIWTPYTINEDLSVKFHSKYYLS